MNKKGFTLIELLAVIIILAIIALIIVPSVLNIIGDNDRKTIEISARNLIDASNVYYASYKYDKSVTFPKTFNSSEGYNDLNIKGEKIDGSVTIENNGKVKLAIFKEGVCAYKNLQDDDVTVVENFTIEQCYDKIGLTYVPGENPDEDTPEEDVPSGDLPMYVFADYYISNQNNIINYGMVPSVNVSSNSITKISAPLPDDVTKINVIDLYEINNMNYIEGGQFTNGPGLVTNYVGLIDNDFCSKNPTVCHSYDKANLNYVSDSWEYTGTSVIKENHITFTYNINDKSIYVTNGATNNYDYFLAMQFVVPGYQPSNWEFFSNNLPCLHRNTTVYVYDRRKKKFKKKKIKDVTYDDELLVWDFDKAEFAIAKPLWIKQKQTTDEYNLLTFSDGSKLRTINQHRIYNKEKGMFTLAMSDDTPIGTTTFNSKGEYVKLVSKKVIKKPTDYYNVITEYHINLFTDDILTSCRLSNIYEIKDMKYVKNLINNNEFNNIDTKWINGLRLKEQPLDINKNSMVKYESIEEYIKHLEELDINKI